MIPRRLAAADPLLVAGDPDHGQHERGHAEPAPVDGSHTSRRRTGQDAGTSRMLATAMITVHCTSSALRIQTVNIDQVSALKKPTCGER
jgi:hypothetical protein